MKLLRTSLLSAWLGGAALAAGPPDELPAFTPGLWSFSLSINHYGASQPQVRTMTRCADPADEIRKKWQSLATQACQFSPVTRDGSRYSYSSACDKQGRRISMRSVILAESADSYRVDTESHTPTEASREIVVARRVGACPN